MSHAASALGGLRIRAATAADLDWLAEGAIAMAWETEHKRLDPATIRRGIEAGLSDRGKARYFVAEHDGAAAGTLMLTCEWSDWRNGEWWWIQSVFVPVEHRRRGVFAALYAHVEALARATPGIVGLRLYVEHDNAAAAATYASLGMRDAGYRLYEAEFGCDEPRG